MRISLTEEDNEFAYSPSPGYYHCSSCHEELLTMMVEYPKILICSLSRINMRDTQSNNLLLRNLLGDWPKERLAQIYSGGDNGDEGFCGQTYRLSAEDRRWGSLFFRLKGSYPDLTKTDFLSEGQLPQLDKQRSAVRIKHHAGKLCMETGLYELIFRLRPSRRLMAWAEAAAPDIIFAQGYSLSFVTLPTLLKERLHKPIVYYSSDDWPSYLYQSQKGRRSLVSLMMTRRLSAATAKLFMESDLPFSFNDIMGAEYERRYGKSFPPLMHGDDPERFRHACVRRLQAPGVCSIVAAGGFDDSRWPLLLDLEEACCRLNRSHECVRATVFAANMSAEGYERLRSCRYIDVRDDPGHDQLPSYLKGADILFLPETFDAGAAHANRYSISTKAHLFMFSGVPILVYGHEETGLVSYAKRGRWALVVDERNIDSITAALEVMVHDAGARQELITTADLAVRANHDSAKIREAFLARLAAPAVCGKGTGTRDHQ